MPAGRVNRDAVLPMEIGMFSFTDEVPSRILNWAPAPIVSPERLPSVVPDLTWNVPFSTFSVPDIVETELESVYTRAFVSGE